MFILVKTTFTSSAKLNRFYHSVTAPADRESRPGVQAASDGVPDGPGLDPVRKLSPQGGDSLLPEFCGKTMSVVAFYLVLEVEVILIGRIIEVPLKPPVFLCHLIHRLLNSS